MTGRSVPRQHWRSYGGDPLPTGEEALVQPFGAAGRLLSPFLSVGTRVVIGLALRRYAKTLDRAGSPA